MRVAMARNRTFEGGPVLFLCCISDMGDEITFSARRMTSAKCNILALDQRRFNVNDQSDISRRMSLSCRTVFTLYT